jgi:hypothetical protein
LSKAKNTHRVIASEAKQSSSAPKLVDCFVAEPVIGPGHFGPDPLAPRNDEVLKA